MLVTSVQGTEIAQTSAKATTQSVDAAPVQKAYYFSPALVIDPKSGTDVLEYRNSTTGAVINQYPSEKDIKAYAQASAPAQKPTAAEAEATKSVAAALPAAKSDQATSTTSASTAKDSTATTQAVSSTTAVVV